MLRTNGGKDGDVEHHEEVNEGDASQHESELEASDIFPLGLWLSHIFRLDGDSSLRQLHFLRVGV